jgi:serine/threonine-protein kinase HipA
MFCNGDAHLKNFSLLESPQGDYILSPAYDLINTQLHADDSAMALNDGLFKDFEMTESFEANGYYAYDDFFEFGRRIGLIQSRMERILQTFMTDKKKVHLLIAHSYLSKELKKSYKDKYLDKLKAINYSFSGRV